MVQISPLSDVQIPMRCGRFAFHSLLQSGLASWDPTAQVQIGVSELLLRLKTMYSGPRIVGSLRRYTLFKQQELCRSKLAMDQGGTGVRTMYPSPLPLPLRGPKPCFGQAFVKLGATKSSSIYHSAQIFLPKRKHPALLYAQNSQNCMRISRMA